MTTNLPPDADAIPLAQRAPGAAELFMRLHEALHQPDMVKARRWFESVFSPTSLDEWQRDNGPNSEGARYFRAVTGHWQIVAVLWKHGYLPRELIFSTSREFRRVWERSRDFVVECRAAGYGVAFLRELEEMCEAFDAWLEGSPTESLTPPTSPG